MLEQSSLSFSAPEEWRAVPGYDGRYDVSDLGRVRSLRYRNHAVDWARSEPLIMRPSVRRDGYGYVKLAGKVYPVHRLVLLTFVGPCPTEYVTGHLNGQRTDNRRENLRWITQTENQEHRFLHGTDSAGDRHYSRSRPDLLPRGEGHGNAKLTDALVREIRRRADNGERYPWLAKQYGIHRRTINDVASRRRWRHVTDEAPL